MAQPQVTQWKSGSIVDGITSGVTEDWLTFDADCAAGATIVAGVAVSCPSSFDGVNNSAISQVIAERLDGGGSPDGHTHALIPDHAQKHEYEKYKQEGIYRFDGVQAGRYRVRVVAGAANSSVAIAGILELANAASPALVIGLGAATQAVGTSFTWPTAPESGNLPADDGLAIIMHSASNGPANLAQQTPPGWTQRGKNDDGTGNRQIVFFATKALSSVDPVNVTLTSAADEFLRAGSIVVLMPASGPTLTKYVKVVNENDDPDGITSIQAAVFANPLSGFLLGSPLFEVAGQSWASIEGGKSVMLIPVPDVSTWFVSGYSLGAGDTCKVVLQRSDKTSAGHGVLDATIVEV